VVAACAAIRDLLGAEDAYVLKSGDPHFLRLGDDTDPTAYEIKQRGYWHAWREAAAHPESPLRLLGVRDRLVEELLEVQPGLPATHLATVLPGDESNSELLVVRGPWPRGLDDDQIEALLTVRPLMAYLVSNVLDGERQERLRSQMRVLAEVAEAFTAAVEGDNPLVALATALARASGFAWVAILLFDASIERVLDRAVNLSRHSNTEIAARGQEGRESENSGARDLLVARHVAWTRQPYCVTDISDPNEQMLVNDELRPYYERAHIISMASFPVFDSEQMLGTVTFCGGEQHAFGPDEVDFLQSLVSQAAITLKAIRLTRDLREADQRLRGVFANAPVFITVFDAEGTVLLSEGAGLRRLGQRAGEMVGKSVYSLVPSPMDATIRRYIERGLAGETFEASMRMNDRDFETRYAPLRGDSGEPTGVIGVTIDVTDQLTARRALHAANEELRAAKERAEELARQAESSRARAEYFARHDALTGVLSRRAWFEGASRTGPVAVAVLDIDRFKSINDRFGHPAGDSVLRDIASRISGALNGEGVLGRLGGEEFGVYFHVSFEEAEAACRRVVDIVASVPCLLPGGTILPVTISAGLAPCRRSTDSAQQALDRAYELADRALYSAKESGRHRLVVSRAA
jgi:diguanylate cyclase (GGDEF)-like protein/PAS domain S-box-containing protein